MRNNKWCRIDPDTYRLYGTGYTVERDQCDNGKWLWYCRHNGQVFDADERLASAKYLCEMSVAYCG